MKNTSPELFEPAPGVESKRRRVGRPCLPEGMVRVRVVIHKKDMALVVKASKETKPRKSIPMVGGIFLSRGLCAAGGVL